MLTDPDLHDILWDILYKLFEKRIVLDFTEHLSDRQLYCLIYRHILPAREKKLDLGTNYLHWDCAGANGDPEVWLRYYASDDEREAWADTYRQPLPPRCKPPVPPLPAARAGVAQRPTGIGVSPVRPPRQSAQPSRCGGRSARSASSLPKILHAAASNSSDWPANVATLPKSKSSITGPECPKFDSGAGPPLQAATHSGWRSSRSSTRPTGCWREARCWLGVFP